MMFEAVVTVPEFDDADQPTGSDRRKVFMTGMDEVASIHVHDEGVAIRTEDGMEDFYPWHRVLVVSKDLHPDG